MARNPMSYTPFDNVCYISTYAPYFTSSKVINIDYQYIYANMFQI